MTTTTGTVYALVDPRNNHVRYIGATTQALTARLAGHRVTRTRRIKAWVDELASHELTPRIQPIHEGVPEAELWDLERAEITRRVIAGEPLLNESATAKGRRRIEQQREQERIVGERAAWGHVAEQVRAAVGGPLPPGDVPPIPLHQQIAEADRTIARIEDGPEFDCADHNLRLTRDTRVHMAQADASDTLWRSVQPIWGRLRGSAGQHFEYILSARVSSVFQGWWSNHQDAAQYLALLPWGIVAVGPWAALAERAGMDASGQDFIDWVTDDVTVREALTVLLLKSGGHMGPLSALDNCDNLCQPSTGLVTMTAAHHPGFDVPQELNQELKAFLESMLRDRQLTAAMADLLLHLDPRALDKLLGPDHASAIDVQLDLPTGTSRDVMRALLDRCPGPRLGKIEGIVARAEGAFPTVDAPSFNEFRGNTVPMFRAITATLTAAGVLAAPTGRTPADLVSDIRSLWCADLRWLERAA